MWKGQQQLIDLARCSSRAADCITSSLRIVSSSAFLLFFSVEHSKETCIKIKSKLVTRVFPPKENAG